MSRIDNTIEAEKERLEMLKMEIRTMALVLSPVQRLVDLSSMTCSHLLLWYGVPQASSLPTNISSVGDSIYSARRQECIGTGIAGVIS